MVRTELDQPADIVVECKICGKPLRARYHWVYDRWLRGSVHDACADLIRRHLAASNAKNFERNIPEKFREFDPKLAPQEALAKAQAFDPDCEKHTLAILGPPGTGKSRIAWGVAGQYFDALREQTGANRWLDAYQFETLLADFDRHTAPQIAKSGFVLIDDIGCVDASGRERALLQAAIRSRIKAHKRSILTIDDMEFDRDLLPILKQYALVVTI